MEETGALPADVVALFRELECVLSDARSRLDALVRVAVPAQDTQLRLTDPLDGR